MYVFAWLQVDVCVCVSGVRECVCGEGVSEGQLVQMAARSGTLRARE